MPAYAYEAMTPAGKSTKGIIEAASAAAARSSLRQRNLAPLSVEPTVAKKGKATKGAGFGRAKISRRALTLLTRQLATLIGSGIGVEQALKTVADQQNKPAVTSLLLNLRASVLDGRSFAQALGEYPQVFGDFYRASVAAGETSGQLGQVMEHLSGFVETRAKNRQTVQLALLYPAILAVVSLAVIVALLTFVVPDIVRVFTSRGAELPFLTRSLITVSDFINAWGIAMLGVLAAVILGGASLLRQPAMRLRLASISIAFNADAGVLSQDKLGAVCGYLGNLDRQPRAACRCLDRCYADRAKFARPRKSRPSHGTRTRRDGAFTGAGRCQSLPPDADRDDRKWRSGGRAGDNADPRGRRSRARSECIGSRIGGTGRTCRTADHGWDRDAFGALDPAADR